MKPTSKLLVEWEKKLKDSGFDDIEKDFQFHSTRFYQVAKRDNVAIEESEQYWDKCFEFLELYDFKTTTDKIIWTLYCNGESCRKIEQTLNQKKLKKSTISATIKRLKEIMMNAY